jgi:hypothetical protein
MIDQRNDSEQYHQLLRLIDRCGTEELDAGDIALIRSSIRHVQDPDSMNSLLALGFECEPFLGVVSDIIASNPRLWPHSTLVRLTESLLFNGLDREASVIADELRRRDPKEARTIRLWAISAGEPEATMRRFATALWIADDPATVISDARDFASKNVGTDLMSIIEEAIARHENRGAK